MLDHMYQTDAAVWEAQDYEMQRAKVGGLQSENSGGK